MLGSLHWPCSATLEAHPVNLSARQATTSSSICSGENYRVQSIQMCPTKLNSSSSDQQPLLPVRLHGGNLTIKDGGREQVFMGAKKNVPFSENSST